MFVYDGRRLMRKSVLSVNKVDLRLNLPLRLKLCQVSIGKTYLSVGLGLNKGVEGFMIFTFSANWFADMRVLS